jgi:hypothetical protein
VTLAIECTNTGRTIAWSEQEAASTLGFTLEPVSRCLLSLTQAFGSMSRFRVIIVFLYISLAAKLVYAVDERRVIPIVVSTVATNDYRVGQPLLVEVDVFNGLDSEIGFLTFSLTPNAWNGEVFSVHVIDIYREGKPPSILIRPKTSA